MTEYTASAIRILPKASLKEMIGLCKMKSELLIGCGNRKKTYVRPNIIVHGTVETMTRGGIFPGGRGSCKRKRTTQCGS